MKKNETILRRVAPSVGVLAGASMALVAAAGVAQAQSDEEPAENEDEVRVEDTIVVQGIRSSIQNAIEEKRRAEQIIDSIAEEDIGKLPDQNIAESLQRITGVQIGRELGEGAAKQIRGLSQNRVENNGRTSAGPEGDRSDNFTLLASELFSGVEVSKSPTADQIEGSLGGTVNLRTRMPFDARGRVTSASARIIEADSADDTGYQASGYFGNRFDTDIGEIGIGISASYLEQSRREESIQLRWRQRTNVVDIDGDGTNDPVFTPQQVRLQDRLREQERFGVTATLQWRPTDNLEFFLSGDLNQLEHNTFSNILQVNVSDNLVDPTTAVISENSTVLAGDFSNSNTIPNGWNQPTDSETFNIASGFEWNVGALDISGEVSVADGGREFLNSFLNGRSNCQGNGPCDKDISNPILTYDLTTGNDLPNVSLAQNDGTVFGVDTLENFVLNNYFGQDQTRSTDEFAARLDFDYELAHEFFDSFEFGVRYADESNQRERAIIRTSSNRNRDPAAFPELVSEPAVTGFLSDFSGNLPRDFASINPFLLGSDIQAIAEIYQVNFAEDAEDDEGFFYDVSEETLAGYAKTNFSGEFIVPFSGNLGVRVIETKVSSSGFQDSDLGGFVPITIDREYTDVLPSFNIAFEPTEDIILRFAASKVLSRPPLPDLSVGTRLNFGDLTGSSGNPGLDPFRANQFDASFEWYFDEASLLNLAIFHKDVESFFTSGEIIEQRLVPGSDNLQDFQLRVPINGEGGQSTGFEIGLARDFTFLPAPFDGFGAVVNYTYVDSSTANENVQTGEALPLEDLSENSYNLIGYYEKGPVGVRLAYNWRSEFLDQTAGFNNQPVFETDRGQLDLSGSYDVTDRIQIQLEAINLTKSNREQFMAIRERFFSAITDESLIRIGVRARF